MTGPADVLIVGAGIAGSALAFELAARGAAVLLLEREPQPGYHSTGRSAAMLTLTYGSEVVRALAQASAPFLAAPPAGFAPHPLLSPRGMLHVARRDQRAALERAQAEAERLLPAVRRLDAAEVLATAPLLAPGYAAGGLLEPDAQAIDVAALQQGYLRGLRRQGEARLRTDAEVLAIARAGGTWQVATRAGAFAAPVLVNAAGAWADEVARLAGAPPLGLVPKRRTAILVDPPDGQQPDPWPMVIDVEERFYIKPDAGKLLVSPADATPVPPCDVQPEDLDVAEAAARYEAVTGRPVRRISHRWAGLRSFVADEGPVVGEEPAAPGFFWLAALGGFGVMTAPALARLAAGLILDGAPPPDAPLPPDRLSPARLRR